MSLGGRSCSSWSLFHSSTVVKQITSCDSPLSLAQPYTAFNTVNDSGQLNIPPAGRRGGPAAMYAPHAQAVLCPTQTAAAAAASRISPGNKAQVVTVYAAILADIFVTAYTDNLRTTEVLAIILLLSLQIFLLLAIILAFFLLTTSISPHVQLGLYNKYLKQHRAVFVLSLLTLLLVGSTGAYRLVLVYGGATFQDLWDNNQGYLALWVLQRLSLLVLQCSAAHATAMSLKDPDQAWLSPSAIRLMNSMRHV